MDRLYRPNTALVVLLMSILLTSCASTDVKWDKNIDQVSHSASSKTLPPSIQKYVPLKHVEQIQKISTIRVQQLQKVSIAEKNRTNWSLIFLGFQNGILMTFLLLALIRKRRKQNSGFCLHG